MKTNRDNPNPDRDAARLSDPLRPPLEKQRIHPLEPSSIHSRTRRNHLDGFQSAERNINKTMATAPAVPYNPHK